MCNGEQFDFQSDTLNKLWAKFIKRGVHLVPGFTTKHSVWVAYGVRDLSFNPNNLGALVPCCAHLLTYFRCLGL